MSESWDSETQTKMLKARQRLRTVQESWKVQKDVPVEARQYAIDEEEMILFRELIKWYFNSLYGRYD